MSSHFIYESFVNGVLYEQPIIVCNHPLVEKFHQFYTKRQNSEEIFKTTGFPPSNQRKAVKIIYDDGTEQDL